MEDIRVRRIRVIPVKIRTEKRVAIYCRVSTTKDSPWVKYIRGVD